VDECKNCKVLIGPCDSSTFVRDCKNCTFWITTRQLRTRDCKDCIFYLHSHTEPIIESSQDLAFAPFSASYPGLTQHFEGAKLDAGKNFWSAIFDFTGRPDGANWRILPFTECSELEVEFFGESGKADTPAPALSHELLCAPPPASNEGAGQSVANIPQTRPSKPSEPSPGAKLKKLKLTDGPEKALEPAEPEKSEKGRGKGKPIKLRKPKWTKVNLLDPDSRGINVFVKVVKVLPAEGTNGATEVVLGDATGVLTMLARGEQVATCEPGKILRIQNARVVMVKGFMRLDVNKWGVVKPAPDHGDFEPKVSKDMSAVEYELTES